MFYEFSVVFAVIMLVLGFVLMAIGMVKMAKEKAQTAVLDEFDGEFEGS